MASVEEKIIDLCQNRESSTVIGWHRLIARTYILDTTDVVLENCEASCGSLCFTSPHS
jgi:hypothetical protein